VPTIFVSMAAQSVFTLTMLDIGLDLALRSLPSSSSQPTTHWEVVDRELFGRGFSRTSLRPRGYAAWIYDVDILWLIFSIAQDAEIGLAAFLRLRKVLA
jgi:hypothetical protein